MINLGFIWEPHFNSKCFRVASKDQRGEDCNFIAVCCSPSYNGIYRWQTKDIDKCTIWMNGKNPCLCIPIDICTKVNTLEGIKRPEVRACIIKQQKAWAKRYREKAQSWFIKEN